MYINNRGRLGNPDADHEGAKAGQILFNHRLNSRLATSADDT